jgi:hypothetical protein
MLGRTAPRQRRNQEKSWPRFTRQLRLDLRPGDMRWRQDLRPLSCMSNYLVQSLILRWGSLLGKHQHLSIGAGIATGWPWLCLLPVSIVLPHWSCTRIQPQPSILEGRRDPESTVHFFKITLAFDPSTLSQPLAASPCVLVVSAEVSPSSPSEKA